MELVDIRMRQEAVFLPFSVPRPSRYQSLMSSVVDRHPVPPQAAHAILGSPSGALAVAQHVGGSQGSALALVAKHGFISGMDLGLLVAAVVVAFAAARRARAVAQPSNGGWTGPAVAIRAHLVQRRQRRSGLDGN
jgi:hypothetical protein